MIVYGHIVGSVLPSASFRTEKWPFGLPPSVRSFGVAQQPLVRNSLVSPGSVALSVTVFVNEGG